MEHLPAAVAAQAAAPATAPQAAATPALPRTGKIADRTRRRHACVHQMLADGRNFAEIAADPGLARNTVRRFARAASPDELLARDGTGRRTSILDEHEPYLRERWNSGCTNAALLWQEIRARGYPRSCRQVRGYLARFRGNATIPAPVPAPPKARVVTGWIMTRPDQLTDADRASLDAILAASPELAAVTASVRAFAVIMTERRGRKQHWTGYAGNTYGAGSGYSCRWSSRLSCSRPCSNGSRVTRPGGPARDTRRPPPARPSPQPEPCHEDIPGKTRRRSGPDAATSTTGAPHTTERPTRARAKWADIFRQAASNQIQSVTQEAA